MIDGRAAVADLPSDPHWPIFYPTAGPLARLHPPARQAELVARVTDGLGREFPKERGGFQWGRADHTARVDAVIAHELQAFLARLSTERDFLPPDEPRLVIDRLRHDLTGLGVLQALIDDPANEGVRVVGTHVWVVRGGRSRRVDQSLFANDGEVLALAQDVVAKLGARLDDGCPAVTVRLPADGSRFSAYHPAIVATRQPHLRIRMHRLTDVTLDALHRPHRLFEEDVLLFLRAAIRARLNLIIAGPMGSGKTTLMDAGLAEHVARLDETGEEIWITTIEEAGELSLARRLPTVLALEARPPNAEGQGAITLDDLFHGALRSDAEILVVGEARGAEAYTLIQAMSSGHDGSMATVHATSPPHAVTRLTNMIGEGGRGGDQRLWRALVADAVHLIVQLGLPGDADGRRIVEIYEVIGADRDTGEVIGQPLWRWRGGALRRSAVTRPCCLDRLARNGVAYHWVPGTDSLTDGGRP